MRLRGLRLPGYHETWWKLAAREQTPDRCAAEGPAPLRTRAGSTSWRLSKVALHDDPGMPREKLTRVGCRQWRGRSLGSATAMRVSAKARRSPRITPDVVVTVVTAARTPPADWLLEAYDSLRQPGEVSWEWALQIDGTVEDVRAVPPSIRSDPRVRVEPNGRWLGTAATRNRALSRSNGEFVQNLDADDLVLPGALDSAVRALQEEPTAAFAFGRTVHLHEDGRLTHPWETEVAFPPGRIEPGVVSDFWLRHGWDGMPISPVMWRRSHLFAIGGWAALSTLEDTAPVMTAAELWPSVYIDLDAQVYRINETQATASAAFAAERRPNEAFLRERLFALKRLGLRPLPP
jgi:glycosyl transferase family 2